MQVKDLSIEEFKSLIRETVTETLETLLNDPDEGKTLKLEVVEELRESLERTQSGERGIPAEEVARKFGLNW